MREERGTESCTFGERTDRSKGSWGDEGSHNEEKGVGNGWKRRREEREGGFSRGVSEKSPSMATTTKTQEHGKVKKLSNTAP